MAHVLPRIRADSMRAQPSLSNPSKITSSETRCLMDKVLMDFYFFGLDHFKCYTKSLDFSWPVVGFRQGGCHWFLPIQSGREEKQLALGGDSFSILFNHRSFQKPDPFSLGFRRFYRKKDPGKNGEGAPRIARCQRVPGCQPSRSTAWVHKKQPSGLERRKGRGKSRLPNKIRCF